MLQKRHCAQSLSLLLKRPISVRESFGHSVQQQDWDGLQLPHWTLVSFSHTHPPGNVERADRGVALKGRGLTNPAHSVCLAFVWTAAPQHVSTLNWLFYYASGTRGCILRRDTHMRSIVVYTVYTVSAKKGKCNLNGFFFHESHTKLFSFTDNYILGSFFQTRSASGIQN